MIPVSPAAEACRKAPGGGVTVTPESDVVGRRSTATGSGSSLPRAQAMRGNRMCACELGQGNAIRNLQ